MGCLRWPSTQASGSAFLPRCSSPSIEIGRVGIGSLSLPIIAWKSRVGPRYGKTCGNCTYHREGEGDNGVIVGARDAAGSETGGEIGQIAAVGRGETGQEGEGENVFLHFENI